MRPNLLPSLSQDEISRQFVLHFFQCFATRIRFGARPLLDFSPNSKWSGRRSINRVRIVSSEQDADARAELQFDSWKIFDGLLFVQRTNKKQNYMKWITQRNLFIHVYAHWLAAAWAYGPSEFVIRCFSFNNDAEEYIIQFQFNCRRKNSAARLRFVLYSIYRNDDLTKNGGRCARSLCGNTATCQLFQLKFTFCDENEILDDPAAAAIRLLINPDRFRLAFEMRRTSMATNAFIIFEKIDK